MRLQFLMQRFSEQVNVSLRCSIRRVAEDCLISDFSKKEALRPGMAKPRQDFLDVFAELARLTFRHIST
jgi:hypothetical protein